MTHVFLTGEVGVGKSTALRQTLALLNARAYGLETYATGPRVPAERRLYMRAYGDAGPGMPLGKGCTREQVAPAFDEHGAALLARARGNALTHGGLIVIDECGRLEALAFAYHRALADCLACGAPVLGVLRKQGASWADWIREDPAVLLLEVTRENRGDIPARAAAILAESRRQRTSI